MKTEVAIDGTRFLINGRPTYEGRTYRGRSIEGLMFNSRMIQAIFDDECPATREIWSYPDTGKWDPERNTDELCRALQTYRRHGLLAVTVGLQGGGSVYTPEIYGNYLCSAYTEQGELKPPFLNRLERVLRAADEAGMVVIVNYFYFKQARRIRDEETICRITELVTRWLLETGYGNILIDIANEASTDWSHECFHPHRVHRLIEIVQGTTLDGRRLPASVSGCWKDELPTGKWLDREDFALPHGNACTPERLRRKLVRLRESPEHRRRPRPIMVNEDGIFLDNLEVAVEEGCSWGYYSQGYGSRYRDLMDWTTRDREDRFEDLTGFQTLPVNWSINTKLKRDFFDRVAKVTGGG